MMAEIEAVGGVMTRRQRRLHDSWWLNGRRVVPGAGGDDCFVSKRLKVCAAEW
jgi:hypothetical protein